VDVDYSVRVLMGGMVMRSRGRRRLALGSARPVRVEARHGRPVQHERGHRDEHNARDETTQA
jgi:hypothetical protein